MGGMGGTPPTATVREARGGGGGQKACYNVLQLVRYIDTFNSQLILIVKEPLYSLCRVQTFTTMIHYCMYAFHSLYS